jgi:hypothetical protein
MRRLKKQGRLTDLTRICETTDGDAFAHLHHGRFGRVRAGCSLERDT